MTPNVTTVAYPEFAREGNKTEPNQQKYLRGFLPEETFPAEWENWIENRTSNAITALNSIANPVQNEINNVIAAAGAEPDVTNNSQLLNAIRYLVNQATPSVLLAAYPVGSLYWTSKAPNDGGDPNVLFGGTWQQIKDRFVLAAGDTYTNGAIGGASTVTLTKSNIPKHNHNSVDSTSGSADLTTHSNSGHNHAFGFGQGNNGAGSPGVFATNSAVETIVSWENAHTHKITLKSYGGDSNGNTTAHNNMPPYVVKYCWVRTE